MPCAIPVRAACSSACVVYHGPDGLVRIAERVHRNAATLAAGFERLGFAITHEHFFDTVRVEVGAHGQEDILAAAAAHRMNLRVLEPGTITVALDETTTEKDVADLWTVFNNNAAVDFSYADVTAGVDTRYDERFRRMWRYYLATSMATFRARRSQLWQIVLSKGGVTGGYDSLR